MTAVPAQRDNENGQVNCRAVVSTAAWLHSGVLQKRPTTRIFLGVAHVGRAATTRR